MASFVWTGTTSATWSVGSNWSVGGVAQAAPPTSSDDVAIGTGTSATNNACTLAANTTVRSVNFTGYTGTFTHNSAITLSVGDATAGAGNVALKLVNTMTYTKGNGSTSAWAFISTSATVQTIDATNATNMGNTTFGATGSPSYQLVAAMSTSAASTVLLTAGTLDTNGQTCSWGKFGTGGNSGIAKTLTLGASNITLVLTPGTVWDATVGNNLVINAGTSSIACAQSSCTFAGNGLTYNNLSLTGTGSCVISGANTFNNLTRTLAAGNNGALVFSAATTTNGVFTVTASNSGATAGRLTLSPSLPTAYTSSPAVITVNGSYSFSNVDFNFITAAGTAALPWTGTSMGDGTGNTNITFDASRTLYGIGAGTAFGWQTLARWSLSSGGAAATTAPLPQDDVNIDANSGVSASCTFTSGLRCLGRNISFSGITNAATAAFNHGGFSVYVTGNLTYAAGMSVKTSAATSLLLASGGNTATLTTNNISHIATDNPTFGIAIQFGCTTGSISTVGNITTAGLVSMVGGTFNAGSSNITCPNVSSVSGNTRAINLGSGTWTVNGTGTVWTLSNNTGLTFNAQTSTILISDTSATSKTFISNGQAFNNLTTSGGSGAIIFSNNTAVTLSTLTIAAPATITPIAGYTITLTTLVATGSAGNIITMSSLTPGTPFTISKTSGIVSCDWLSLKDSAATGGATFYAGANSTSVSGNSGWIFTAPPTSGSDSNNLLLLGMG